MAVFWKALLSLYMTALPVRYLSHTPVSESHLKNESKWYLCSSSLSIYSHLVGHAAHGDLAPKRAENLKFSSPPKGANVGQRPPPRVDGATSSKLLPLYKCARASNTREGSRATLYACFKIPTRFEKVFFCTFWTISHPIWLIS